MLLNLCDRTRTAVFNMVCPAVAFVMLLPNTNPSPKVFCYIALCTQLPQLPYLSSYIVLMRRSWILRMDPNHINITYCGVNSDSKYYAVQKQNVLCSWNTFNTRPLLPTNPIKKQRSRKIIKINKKSKTIDMKFYAKVYIKKLKKK